MNVFIIGKNKLYGGPQTWKNNLIESLKEDVEYKEIAYQYSFVHRLFDSLKKIKNANILHFYIFDFFSLIIYISSLFFNKPKVFTLHGNFIEELKQKRYALRIFYKFIFPKIISSCDKVTFPSKYLFNVIIKEHPELKYKSVVIYNPIFKKVEKNKLNIKDYILTITNFDYIEKCNGINLLLSSLNDIKSKDKVYILGDGIYFDSFKKRLSSNKIIFCGYSKNVISYIERAKLIVHCTFLDNLPTAVIEGTVRKKPLIASNVGGIPEIVCKESLFNNDKKELAAKLNNILNSPNIRKRIVLMNYEKSRLFNPKAVSKNFLKIYRGLK